MKNPKKRSSKSHRTTTRDTEQEEIELLNKWIESNKPNPGTNPLALKPPSKDTTIGQLGDDTFSLYVGCRRFGELPVSENTKRGLKEGKFVNMTEVQAAALPHALCGRDVLGAAKTGSGKTLAFVVPVLEKLYRARWGPEDGVGSIILSPTRELAGQIFDVLKIVGKHHGFSAGLLIGGGTDLDTERDHVSELNILVCTPGRLLQHMDETPNFECSQLQILILDEADRILDVGFKKALNAIISQLPRHRQTLLFSATQTKSVQDLARLSLKDPEYISVHEESISATPSRLHQTAIIVPLDQKLDMLWSFIKAHLNTRILVFLSSCKQEGGYTKMQTALLSARLYFIVIGHVQDTLSEEGNPEVKFVFEAFKKLRPGIPLKCLHGRMKQHTRMGIYNMFSEEKRSVLFCTDVASRGLDFNKAVDWVVQVDCPEDVAAYIHRVGRTARYRSMGQSVLFLMPSEMKMLEKLQDKKVPVQFKKTNMQKLQPISKLLASLLAQNKGMPDLAKRAFITYLKSIYLQKDKEVFDVMKLPLEEYSSSLGLPMTPKIRFLNKKTGSSEVYDVQVKKSDEENISEHPRERPVSTKEKDDKEDESFFVSKTISEGEKQKANVVEIMPEIRSKSKKKLKINVHRPVGTRVVFDDEGDTLAPLATIAETQNANDTVVLDIDKVSTRYAEERAALEQEDEEDKRLDRKRRKELRKKQKTKVKRGRQQEDDDVATEDELSESEGECNRVRLSKKPKVYFDDGCDGDQGKRGKGQADIYGDSSSLAEQEALALKLLNSLHS